MIKLSKSFQQIKPYLSGAISIDIETSGLIYYEETPLLWALSSNGHTFVLKECDVRNEVPEFLQWVNRTASRIVVHNAQFENKFFLWHYGVMLNEEKVWDTMIADQNIHKGLVRSSNLESVESRHNITRDYTKSHLQKSFIGMKPTDHFTQEQIDYAGDDVIELAKIAATQFKQMRRDEMLKCMKLEMRVMRSIVKMSTRGVKFDKELHIQKVTEWRETAYKLECELDELLRKEAKMDLAPRPRYIAKYDQEKKPEKFIPKVTNLFGQVEEMPVPTTAQGRRNYKDYKKLTLVTEFNYSSSDQLKKLFRQLEIPLPINSKDKESFDEEAVNEWLSQHSYHWAAEFMRKLKEVKSYYKLCTTYGLSILEKVSPDGRMRSNYGQCYTATCRLNSSALINRKTAKEMNRSELGINMANIPPQARHAFVPDDDCVFVDVDMSGQEIAIVGSNSGEPMVVDSVTKGADLHSWNATNAFEIIFGQRIELSKSTEPITVYSKYMQKELTFIPKKLRDHCKALFFGSLYGAGYKRVKIIMKPYLTMFFTERKHNWAAKAIVKAMKDRMPLMYGWLNALIAKKEADGYIRADWTGRRKYFVGRAFGDVMNYPIQSGGATTIKLAMWRIDKLLDKLTIEKGEYVGEILISVYDQVVVQAKKKYVLEVMKIVEQQMADALTYSLSRGMKGSADADILRYWIKGFDKNAIIKPEEYELYGRDNDKSRMAS